MPAESRLKAQVTVFVVDQSILDLRQHEQIEVYQAHIAQNTSVQIAWRNNLGTSGSYDGCQRTAASLWELYANDP